MNRKTYDYNIYVLEFFYIYYINENNENDITQVRNERHYGIYINVTCKLIKHNSLT
jgi:hypothetical protein